MEDKCWSFEELLQHLQLPVAFIRIGGSDSLARFLVNCIELGLIRTEESAFLEENVCRLERALVESSTVRDKRWMANKLAITVGGAGNMWVLNAIAVGLGNFMRGLVNCIETTYISPETNEPFLVTITKKQGGKSPMDLRRELLEQIKTLSEGGGATAEQLQSILDANQTPSNPVGLAADPEGETKYPWVRWFGDHFACLRCLAKEDIEFPSDQREAAHADFAARHEWCLPSETATGDVLLTILHGSKEEGQSE